MACQARYIDNPQRDLTDPLNSVNYVDTGYMLVVETCEAAPIIFSNMTPKTK